MNMSFQHDRKQDDFISRRKLCEIDHISHVINLGKMLGKIKKLFRTYK